MSDIIDTSDTSDHPRAAALSQPAEEMLRAISRAMIPSDTGLAVPGADDPEIFADLLRSSAPFHAFLNEGLCAVRNRLEADTGMPLGELDATAEREVVMRLRGEQPELIALVVSLVAQCYYRDARVLASLDMPARPPFPEGYPLAQGDWSLLEPVRARGKIWRDA